MQSYFAIVVAALACFPSFGAGELKMNIPSATANIKIGKTVEVLKTSEPVFRNVICNFSITPTQSSPLSFILAGKVVSNNSGAAQEAIPLFFGSALHPPHLAALTNADGEFRFHVWLADKQTGKPAAKFNKNPGLSFHWEPVFRLQATSMRDATLYLEGKFDKDGAMVSSYTHTHSLGEFLERRAKEKP